MILTNRCNLPAAIVAAIAADPYDAGDCDISCTRLVGPPMIRHLERLHAAELTEDAVDRVWSLLGQAVHAITARAQQAHELSEERLHATVDGMRVSGAFDLFDGETLSDLKVTSAWAIRDGVKPEWIAQVNVLSYLLRVAGWDTKRLQIVAILRDWRRSESQRYGRDYPPQQAVCLDVPLWTELQQLDYVRARVAMHRSDPPQPCTPEDRWDRPSVWAVMRPGRKSALRLLPSEEAALEWRAVQDDAAKLELVHRPGASVRCAGYCSVSAWCQYWRTVGTVADEVAA